MKAHHILLYLLLFLLLCPASAHNQEGNARAMNATIHSEILNEERELIIYLPEDYHTSKDRYPVLYLLDGRTHFHHGTGAVNFLSTYGIIPEMIVVAIVNVDRNRDFSPVHVESMPTTGGAEAFLRFLSEELIPNLDVDYRTSGFNVLMGHSFGGTFAVYSLLTKPELFDAYIAVSPYLQYADDYLVKESLTGLKPYQESKKFFYMTVGDEPDYFEPLEAFSTNLKQKTGGTVKFEYVRMLSEDHASVPYISLFNGIRFVFSDWQLPREVFGEGLDAIDAHYEKITRIYSFETQTPENVINLLGYTYLRNNDIETAISVFQENVKRYPGSANVYDSLGEAYEKNGQPKLARQHYQKAYDLGKQSNDPNTPVYKNNLDRMQKR
jgi:predicted alpha/beta superfamily hydrolase